MARGGGSRDGADRAGEGRPPRRDSRLRRLPVPRRRARPGAAGPADPGRRGRGAPERRAVDGRGDRGGAEAALRRARGEAADGLRADPGRGDRFPDLAGAVRVARAARPRAGARTAWPRRGGGRVSALSVDEFEGRLERYGIERSEEARAVRVGEKETSEQAAIVARYADLFTREQLEELRAAEEAASGPERESVARLRLECQEGLVDRELAEREDELENALLAARVAWDGDELPLRTAQARLATETDYRRRDSLGTGVLAAS